MANLLSQLRSLLTGEKPSSSRLLSTTGKASDAQPDDNTIKVLKKFFYTYRDPADKLVTHVDKAKSFHQGKAIDAYLVALELSHMPGAVIWVTASPENYLFMLLYGDDSPDYEGYLLGLKPAYLQQDIPPQPRALWDALQLLVTNGYLDQKLTFTGKVDPKQQQ